MLSNATMRLLRLGATAALFLCAGAATSRRGDQPDSGPQISTAPQTISSQLDGDSGAGRQTMQRRGREAPSALGAVATLAGAALDVATAPIISIPERVIARMPKALQLPVRALASTGALSFSLLDVTKTIVYAMVLSEIIERRDSIDPGSDTGLYGYLEGERDAMGMLRFGMLVPGFLGLGAGLLGLRNLGGSPSVLLGRALVNIANMDAGSQNLSVAAGQNIGGMLSGITSTASLGLFIVLLLQVFNVVLRPRNR